MGFAIARAFAQQGERVTIIGRRADVRRSAADRLPADAGAEVRPLRADLSRPEDVERAAARLPERVDMLSTTPGWGPPGS